MIFSGSTSVVFEKSRRVEVLFPGSPFDICSAIICWIFVEMENFVIWGWITMEGMRNEEVNLVGLASKDNNHA